MNIWIFQAFEPVPGSNARLMRCGLLERELLARGHHITRWRSAFDHFSRTFLREESVVEELDKNYRVIYTHSIGYKKNISLRRLLDTKQYAKKLKKAFKRFQKPDLIYCAMPSLEMNSVVSDYAEKNNIPILTDIRDLWPDIYIRFFPTRLHKLASLFLYLSRRRLAKTLMRSTAVTAVAEPILDWGLRYMKQQRKPEQKAFFNAYSAKLPEKSQIALADQYWETQGLSRDVSANKLVACYVGSIRSQIEVDTIIQAFSLLGDQYVLVLAGGGPQYEYYRNLANTHSNIIVPGYVNAAQIRTLMKLSHVGLAPYKSTFDFKLSIPTKVIEYLAGSLPVISSLEGMTARTLEENACGLTYPNGDVEQLVHELKNLKSNPELLEQLSKNASVYFEKALCAEKVYAEMADYFLNLAYQHG